MRPPPRPLLPSPLHSRAAPTVNNKRPGSGSGSRAVRASAIGGPMLTYLTDGVNIATRIGFLYCTLYFGMQYLWYRGERQEAEEDGGEEPRDD